MGMENAMKGFMNKDFLLENEISHTLFHEYAEEMPIIDYHCHVSPGEIAQDRQYENISRLWLDGDHYKWRIMRSRGLGEEYITGNKPDWEKFNAYASALLHAIGNPLYHWTHLELQRYFGCYLALGPDTAKEIWEMCNEKLNRGFTVRDIIRQSNVETICTTDDPADDLAYHKKIAQEKGFQVKVYPTFRPDKALAVGNAGYGEYIERLSEASGSRIATLGDLCNALSSRLDYFAKCGCRSADHGLDSLPWSPGKADDEAVFVRALSGKAANQNEIASFQTAMMLFLGREYAKRDIVMQVHYGAQRNINPVFSRTLGPDTGFDSIGGVDCSGALAAYLGALQNENALPKTILYSVNPNDNAMLASLAGAFQQDGVVGKVQSGSAWWFSDAKKGIENHLSTLAEVSVLGSFVGMLTDSRSFLSYTRHEYFRRILCNLLGRWVYNGELPNDSRWLGGIVQDISYNNAKQYFGV